MAQSVSDSLLPVLARLSIAAVFIWMGLVKLFAVAGGFAALSRGDISPLGLLEPIRVVLELGGGIVLLLGGEAKKAAVALLAALAIEYFATESAGYGSGWLAGRSDPAVIAVQRTVALAGALLLAIAYEDIQAQAPSDSDTSFGLVALLGRWSIGGLVALSAVHDVADFGAASRALAAQGVPAASAVLALDVTVRLVASWALIIGFWTRLAALVLLAQVCVAYNPLLLLWRAWDGGAREIAPAHRVMGLIAALIFAFLLDGERRLLRPARRNAVAARSGR